MVPRVAAGPGKSVSGAINGRLHDDFEGGQRIAVGQVDPRRVLGGVGADVHVNGRSKGQFGSAASRGRGRTQRLVEDRCRHHRRETGEDEQQKQGAGQPPPARVIHRASLHLTGLESFTVGPDSKTSGERLKTRPLVLGACLVPRLRATSTRWPSKGTC